MAVYTHPGASAGSGDSAVPSSGVQRRYRSPSSSSPVVALSAKPLPNAKSGSPRTSPAATDAFHDSWNAAIRSGRPGCGGEVVITNRGAVIS